MRTCYWPRAVMAVELRGFVANPGAVVSDVFSHHGIDIVQPGPDRILVDITHCQRDEGSPEAMADRLAVALGRRFPGSAWRIGVAGDRWGAGLAAVLAQTGRINVIPPWEMRERLNDIALDFLTGRDAEMRRFLSLLGIRTCGQLAALPAAVLGDRYGISGRRLWLMCRGRDAASVVQDVIPSSCISLVRVLPPHTTAPRTVMRYLRHMCQRLAARLRRLDLYSGQVRVELHFSSARKPEKIRDGAGYPARAAVGVFSPDVHDNDSGRLFGYVRDLFARSWHERPLVRVRLDAAELQNLSGQLELFVPQCAPSRMHDVDPSFGDSVACTMEPASRMEHARIS